MADPMLRVLDAHSMAVEASADAACNEAAWFNGLKPEEAELCEEGRFACSHCPWRNPFVEPQLGDQFLLSNGRLIEVYFANRRHTIRPEVAYEFPYWRPVDGGRARYVRAFRDWPKLVAGATLKRIGKVWHNQANDPHVLGIFARSQARIPHLRVASAKRRP